MFSLRNFLMIGFRNAVGKMEDYQIILNATGWYEKGVLLEEDLAELQRLIEEKNTPKEEPITEPETEPDVEDIEQSATNEEENVAPVETEEN